MLNKQIESGKLKLVEKKRTLAEILTLNKSKKSYTLLHDHQRPIDADKEAITLLKATLGADDPYKLLSDEYNTFQSQVDRIFKTKDEGWKRRNGLFYERTQLQRELRAAFVWKKTVNDEIFSALRLHAKYLQDEQQRKREEVQRRKQAELEEERELVEIPAFQQEIAACESFSYDQNRVAAANAGAATCNANSGANAANIGQADTTTNVPTGVMLAMKADKKEDVFFVGGGRKVNKTTKASKEKMATDSTSSSPTAAMTTTATTATLKFTLVIMKQLFELKVTVPRSFADLEKTLDALLEKSITLKKNQASATAVNQRKTEERIAN
ncbi:hypothetical protein BG015_003270 [Linnemannia schmuckeri]|uniref:Uncharacterized protein n=1 Tax=Linnemannia schmuckeri TaxID=64567 RepID=A0A9P5RP62_9FUNG|nr:hypothetical protein BG015_003270 [Linnemannia schmuckeri]